MKRVLSFVFAAAIALSFTACEKKSSSAEGGAKTTIAGNAVTSAQDASEQVNATGSATSVTTVKAQAGQQNNQQTAAQQTEWKPNVATTAKNGLPAGYGKGTANPKALDSTVAAKLAANTKSINATVKSPITNDTYKLKFIDDFTGTSLNLSNWSYFTRNYNQAEEQVNRKENVAVKDGSLVITGKQETKTYTGDAETWETPKTSKFTGGAIDSNGKKTFEYGRLEILAKLPYSYGMWPAFWTQGTKKGWPWGGEIDIMEFVGGVDAWNNYRDDEYNSGLHWSDPTTPSDKAWNTTVSVKNGDPDSSWNNVNAHLSTGDHFELPGIKANGGTLADQWHICGIEWNATKMYFYCDGQVFNTIDITKTSMRDAFHQNHYLILNLAMGGSWAGTPNTAKGTVWPQQFKVDWVKVWQKA